MQKLTLHLKIRTSQSHDSAPLTTPLFYIHVVERFSKDFLRLCGLRSQGFQL